MMGCVVAIRYREVIMAEISLDLCIEYISRRRFLGTDWAYTSAVRCLDTVVHREYSRNHASERQLVFADVREPHR